MPSGIDSGLSPTQIADPQIGSGKDFDDSALAAKRVT
jgi:hypothetical protein